MDIGRFRYFGVLPVLLGVLTYIQCAWSFVSLGKGTPAPVEPPKELVVQGLYKHVRNPMYLGVLFLLMGEAIFFASILIFLYTALMFFCFHIFVVVYEEPNLRARFGDLYTKYRDSVPRWIPRWRKTR
ncbi:MAG: isoprenylcysteine carboxylmethyltransferase family protein [Candidatus Aminicenantes bacterium]|nr:isoprenylcysteine carboxylmethyltransferase family protein [Candidatus Aminicenantes bacterium]MDH5705135.1 isoprenylcysteine carboxylmethyltransferase family protein [Candidatus Aminicenantes bacterium]